MAQAGFARCGKLYKLYAIGVVEVGLAGWLVGCVRVAG